MRTIVNKLNQDCPENVALLAHKSFVEVGNLSFLQLSTLRHRGAFSTVSLTFAVCCQLTQSISSGSESANTDMLRRWWMVCSRTVLSFLYLLTKSGYKRSRQLTGVNNETVRRYTSTYHRNNVCRCPDS
jgi:hypothetical protein